MNEISIEKSIKDYILSNIHVLLVYRFCRQ